MPEKKKKLLKMGPKRGALEFSQFNSTQSPIKDLLRYLPNKSTWHCNLPVYNCLHNFPHYFICGACHFFSQFAFIFLLQFLTRKKKKKKPLSEHNDTFTAIPICKEVSYPSQMCHDKNTMCGSDNVNNTISFGVQFSLHPLCHAVSTASHQCIN